MCYISNPETICDVYCCFENGGANVMYYESNGQIFLDTNGNFPAPSGVYSYGASNTFSVINGIITTYHVTTSCVCTTPGQFKYEACFGATVIDASCCGTPNQPFYGFANKLYNCTEAWSNIGMTIHVPDGWYYNPGEPYVARYVNGLLTNLANVVSCI
jgi:hypothetical protein